MLNGKADTENSFDADVWEQKKCDRYNKTDGHLNDTDGWNCERCRNRGVIAEVVRDEVFRYSTMALRECKCMKTRRALERLKRSGLEGVVKKYTFDSYETKEVWQRTIKERAEKFVSDDERGWWFIGGQTGCGKTHICSAIAVKMIKLGNDVRMMMWRDDATRIKSVVNDDEIYQEIIKPFKKCDVLFIDDLFKSGNANATTADINLAFEILNHRYNNRKCTIMCSERTISEIASIDEAIAGRIAQMCASGDYCINVRKDTGKNQRLKGVGEL